ncbi:hypothetical protein ACFVYT_22550 [Streptomyces sp. NPDC058290]|uniref:hypothetical protein n=1 Tax=Streptomyces sp. NPDC058290 TaxID=3346426 RepID=UPI0036E8C4BF
MPKRYFDSCRRNYAERAAAAATCGPSGTGVPVPGSSRRDPQRAGCAVGFVHTWADPGTLVALRFADGPQLRCRSRNVDNDP